MEIHQLTYFIAVAETGGFSRAARRCHVAQPSLSQQIMKLEQELGQPLFDRLGRTVTLTEAGQALLPHARAVLAEVQTIKRGLTDQIEAGYGHLSVGFIPTIAPFLLPAILRTFTERYPQAELAVHEDLTESLIRGLVRGELDVGIMSLPINNKQIVTEELFTEPLLVAFSRQNELVNRTSLRTKDLEAFPFIALNEVHCFGEQVQSFCYQQDITIDIVCYTSQLATVQNCVACGLGISLVPQMLAASDHSGQIQYLAINDDPPQRKVVAASHGSRMSSFLAQAFVEVVKEAYVKLETSFKRTLGQ